MKLGILATHPVQYYAPLYRELHERLGDRFIVYYAHRPTAEEQGVGFGVPFQWDIDLLSGYRSVFLENVSAKPSLQGFWGCNTPGIRRVLREEQFTAFLTMGWYTYSMWQAMTTAWRLGTPLLVRGDSHLHAGASRARQALRLALHPAFVRRFSACLAVGTWSEEYFRRLGAKRVIRSPHFVDNDWFAERAAASASEAMALRRSLGIPDDAVVFLFAGKFEPKKRPLDLFGATELLLRSDPARRSQLHVLLVGDGALRAECEARGRAAGLPATFAGFANQSEMPRYLAASDVLVLPSDGRETWGLVVNEAMACGLPAIVSDQVGCGPDLVTDGSTGRRFACGSIAELAVAMDSFFDRDRRRTAGEAARARVSAFSAVAAADGVMQALELAAST